ncbi:DNA/RNA helicase domain-containing protein [Nitratifractor sp.]|uniref:DNA/RNA helicase domain-containing protein n=1 Tax=Nitratifractor sp. TaxID=2268144 RepID=UPI003434E00A
MDKEYLKNTYRVLLTRARQGMIIFIPEGDNLDLTRPKEFYDETYKYIKQIGIEELHNKSLESVDLPHCRTVRCTIQQERKHPTASKKSRFFRRSRVSRRPLYSSPPQRSNQPFWFQQQL